MKNTKPRIALVMGDLSGIGPELAVRLLARPENLAMANVSVLASRREFEKACSDADVHVPISDAGSSGAVVLVEAPLQDVPVEQKKPTLAGGERVKSDLTAALEMYKAGQCDAILFTPLNKSALHLAGMHEEDELRWFAKILGFDGFTSELNVLPNMTTARVTSHVGIKDVAGLVTKERVLNALQLLNEVLKGAGTPAPHIVVCALNPHAGENGQFGREEIDEILPAIEEAVKQGIHAEGPYPSDTAFVRAQNLGADGVLTMYHDQGQIAVKLMGFDKGVTVQGGLPVPICTPAHGTAYDMVGTGNASLGPTQRAFEVCVGLATQNISASL